MSLKLMFSVKIDVIPSAVKILSLSYITYLNPKLWLVNRVQTVQQIVTEAFSAYFFTETFHNARCIKTSVVYNHIIILKGIVILYLR